MQSGAKKVIFPLILLIIIGGLIFLQRSSSKVHYNEDNVLGNTAGNLYNGGLFCEYGNTIYFSNPLDDGALYSMDIDCTNVHKISSDRVASLNADEHYIYYSRRNYLKQDPMESIFIFRNTGLYRMKHNGSGLAMLFDGGNGISCLAGNTIFYQHYDTQTATQFYSVGIDAKNNQRINTDAILPASVYNNTLYYAGVLEDHYLHAYNLKTKNDYIISHEACYLPIAMPGGVYYISLLDGHSLCRVGYDGSAPVKLVDEFISTFNLTEDEHYLFYQIDGGEDNRLVRLDLSTGFTTTIIDGDYKQLHLTSQYLFFRDFADTTTYAYNLMNDVLSTFHPPVLDEE
ncbi:MAG: DUF5050 domain-containing protein [Lachnospiraceae bacterium]|nr:DUF5050 domain-containing protein [Lachnospiraceae bacterium]